MNVLTSDEAVKEISIFYKSNKLIPFIGAGFSKPLGLPSWEEIIRWLASKLEFDEDLFLSHGNLQQLAEFAKIKDQQVWEEFINYMTVTFDSKESDEKRKNSDSHKLLTKMNFRTIYTTNYDKHLEAAFDDENMNRVVFASLRDFLIIDDPNGCEIVKFHGTLTQPNTLVLTESTYFDRMQLDEAVDQKLRSDILSNSFLFIGYGFNDPNIRFIWYKIHKLKEQYQSGALNLRPSYFVTFGADPVQPVLLNKWNIKVVLLDPIDKVSSLFDFLKAIQSTIL